MQLRLVSDELVLLYTSAKSELVKDRAVRRFFAVVEAVESAASEDDVFALRSLAVVRSADDELLFPLGDRLTLVARREHRADGRVVIAFTNIKRTRT